MLARATYIGGTAARGPTSLSSKVTELLGLTPLLRHAVPTLSGGEKQQVTIMSSVVVQPAPAADGRAAGIARCRLTQWILRPIERVRDEFRSHPFLSHSIGEVSRLADDVVVMTKGAPLPARRHRGNLQSQRSALHRPL